MDIFADKRILTVSRLTALIRSTIEENFEQVWVEGEVKGPCIGVQWEVEHGLNIKG